MGTFSLGDVKTIIGIAGNLKNLYQGDWELLGTGIAGTGAGVARMVGKKWAENVLKDNAVTALHGTGQQIWDNAASYAWEQGADFVEIDRAKKAEAWSKGAEIIEWAIVWTNVEELLFSPSTKDPVKGDRFVPKASNVLKDAYSAVEHAFPQPGKWEGRAANGYIQANQTQLERINSDDPAIDSLMTLDAKMEKLVGLESQLNKDYRRRIGEIRDGLSVLVFVSIAIYTQWGPAASRAFQLAVSIPAILAVGGLAGAMGGQSRDLIRRPMEPVTQGYERLLAAVIRDLEKIEGAQVPAGVKDVLGSAAPDFFDFVLGGAMPDVPSPDVMSGPKPVGVPRPPGVSGSSDVASGSSDEPAPVAARYGGDDLYDGPAEPYEEPKTPAPGVTLPTMADLTAMSGQAAKISGQLAQPLNVANQMVGQVQQFSSMFPQGQGAAAPAAKAALEDTELAGDVEGTEAAPGTEAAERAPIDIEGAAVGAEQAPEQGAAHRIV